MGRGGAWGGLCCGPGRSGGGGGGGGGGEVVDLTCSFWTWYGFFITAHLSSLAMIFRLLVTCISSSGWFALFSVTNYNLMATYLYSLFLDALPTAFSTTSHLAFEIFQLAQMEGSMFHAGTYLVAYICSNFFTLGSFLPQSKLHRCSHMAFSTPLCFLSDPMSVDHVHPTPPLLSHRSCHRHAKKLFSAAATTAKYHRHYHHRVKFLHNHRKPCPKLPSPTTRPSVFRHIIRSTCCLSVNFGKCLHRCILFKPNPLHETFTLPPDTDFSSVTNLLPLSLEPPVHPILLDVLVSHWNPHLYDASWGWDGCCPATKKRVRHHPDIISQFCSGLNPIKLH